MNIYLASSWKNTQQPIVLKQLREAGHQVYDFHNEESAFSWKETAGEPPPWSAQKTAEVLRYPIAQQGFDSDLEAMQRADCFIMLQPCGQSAAIELGWAAGQGKLCIVILADGQEPELMLKMADYLCTSAEEVLSMLKIEKGEDLPWVDNELKRISTLHVGDCDVIVDWEGKITIYRDLPKEKKHSTFFPGRKEFGKRIALRMFREMGIKIQ